MFLVQFIGFFSFCFVCFVLICVILFSYYPLDACLLSNMRHKGGDPDGKRGGHELGRIEGGETNHDILYEKIHFQQKRIKHSFEEYINVCFSRSSSHARDHSTYT